MGCGSADRLAAELWHVQQFASSIDPPFPLLALPHTLCVCLYLSVYFSVRFAKLFLCSPFISVSHAFSRSHDDRYAAGGGHGGGGAYTNPLYSTAPIPVPSVALATTTRTTFSQGNLASPEPAYEEIKDPAHPLSCSQGARRAALPNHTYADLHVVATAFGGGRNSHAHATKASAPVHGVGAGVSDAVYSVVASAGGVQPAVTCTTGADAPADPSTRGSAVRRLGGTVADSEC